MELQTEDTYDFTLPNLLNILFRGRWVIASITALGLIAGIGYGIVVKPLYRAAVQIRPGIVAYTEAGDPLRGGIREDIVHFFEAGLFWQAMRDESRFAEMKSAPVVNAEFVSSAIQFMSGGDVITLTNLSTDPERAVAILEGAVAVFNSQGNADNLSSDLNLTRKGLGIRMQGLVHDIDLVGTKEEKTALEIEQALGELKLIEYERQKLILDLDHLAEENAWRRRAVQSTLADVEMATGRLASAEEMLEFALKSEKTQSSQEGAAAEPADPVSEVLKQTASREQAGRVGDLLVTVNALSVHIYEGRVKADSLQARILGNEQEMERLKLVGELVLAKKEIDALQKIEDLRIKKDKELPYARARLETTLDGEKVKLDIVSPLEQVGRTTVSDRPVRPRKLRAAAILTILAFCGSLGLVLVWEYFQVNRALITRRRRP